MKNRVIKKTVILFTLLAFIGSLFPCACLAAPPLTTSNENSQTQASSHDCCDSENSENKESSNNTTSSDNSCCSGCSDFVAGSSSDIISLVASSSEYSPDSKFVAVSNLTNFQVSSIHLLPGRSPPTSTPHVTSPSLLAATLCRWLI